ncbi:MAG: hypothetical protein C5B52_12830 [Bacteroidetes bacterium]|nr:MAG: hypothetical protein C5B52_12830 [Bacteroidota bacterium]
MFLAAGFSRSLRAQSTECKEYPADCPATESIESCQDSIRCDYLLPQEFTAAHKAKSTVKKMMEQIAAQKSWQVYELDEMNGQGHWYDDAHLQPVPYSKRPPSAFNISFIFIVSQDSLDAWRSWIVNVQHAAADNNAENFKQVSSGLENNSTYKTYFDSSMYYANLQGEYLTQHMSEYQAALQSNDTKALKKHEEDMKKFQSKINYYTGKANATRDKAYASAGNQYESDRNDWKTKIIHYREASILYVKFEFNLNVAEAYGTSADPGNADDINHNAKPVNVPNAVMANIYHNKKGEGKLEAAPNFALILFGGWQSQFSEGYTHHANFMMNRENTDVVSVKKIPCDKIQTISLRLEGSNIHMNEFLHFLDTGKIYGMIVH